MRAWDKTTVLAPNCRCDLRSRSAVDRQPCRRPPRRGCGLDAAVSSHPVSGVCPQRVRTYPPVSRGMQSQSPDGIACPPLRSPQSSCTTKPGLEACCAPSPPPPSPSEGKLGAAAMASYPTLAFAACRAQPGARWAEYFCTRSTGGICRWLALALPAVASVRSMPSSFFFFGGRGGRARERQHNTRQLAYVRATADWLALTSPPSRVDSLRHSPWISPWALVLVWLAGWLVTWPLACLSALPCPGLSLFLVPFADKLNATSTLPHALSCSLVSPIQTCCPSVSQRSKLPLLHRHHHHDTTRLHQLVHLLCPAPPRASVVCYRPCVFERRAGECAALIHTYSRHGQEYRAPEGKSMPLVLQCVRCSALLLPSLPCIMYAHMHARVRSLPPWTF
ncbi:hypothetical protein JOL62DRAFT_235582 [Phyllosticta paracitricarpa]|uniref:Uncharacterized protein n=1 Tax=Phyllosticta paracitricarpa TaxID=2016321 RepID=A0ABR1NI04_9PEZI